MVSVPRNKMAFPTSMRTKLRYATRAVLEPTSTSLLYHAFRANNLRDPQHAVGGHQPRGFNEFMGIYKTYTVTGASISATFMYEGYDGPSTDSGAPYNQLLKNSGADSSAPPALAPCVVGIERATDVLAGGNAENQMERDKNKWGFITANNGCQLVTQRADVKDVFGKAFAVGSEGYTGDDSSLGLGDPTEEILFNVWAGRASSAYTSVSKTKLVCYIVITYDAVFTEPKQLTAS